MEVVNQILHKWLGGVWRVAGWLLQRQGQRSHQSLKLMPSYATTPGIPTHGDLVLQLHEQSEPVTEPGRECTKQRLATGVRMSIHIWIL